MNGPESGPATVEEALAQIERRPNDASLHQQLGCLYQERGDLKEAWRAFMDALTLDPNDPFTCLFFGNLLSICNDKSFSKTLYRHAAKNAPDLAVVHWCLGDLHRQLDEFDQADAAYRQAVEVEPTNPQAKSKLADWERFLDEIENEHFEKEK